MSSRYVLFLSIVCFSAACNCCMGKEADKENFNDFMKNVGSFIKVSQKVISQLNDEIEKSNDTLDRIALDSEKMNLLTGQEEKEIEDLESQVENGVAVFSRNAELREDDSAKHPIAGMRGKDPLEMRDDMLESLSADIPRGSESENISDKPKAKYFGKKDTKLEEFFSNLFKRHNVNQSRPVKGSPEVKIVGDSGNGSTVCIIVRPYYGPETTCSAAKSTKRSVTFINYDPFMDPPMKGPNTPTTTIKINTFGAFVTDTQVFSTPSDYLRQETNSTASIMNNVETSIRSNSVSDTGNEPQLSSYSGQIEKGESQMHSNFETHSIGNLITSSPSWNNSNSAAESTTQSGNLFSLSTSPTRLTNDKPLRLSNAGGFTIIFGVSAGTSSDDFTTRSSISPGTTKMKKGRWNKLFGKNKNIHINEIQSSTMKSQQGNIELKNDNKTLKRDKYKENKNETTLVLTYNIKKDDKNNTLTYNIESISIVSSNMSNNVSTPNKTSGILKPLNKSVNDSILLDVLSNIGITVNEPGRETNNTIEDKNVSSNSTFMESIQPSNAGSAVGDEAPDTTPPLSPESGLVLLIEDLNDAMLKSPLNSEGRSKTETQNVFPPFERNRSDSQQNSVKISKENFEHNGSRSNPDLLNNVALTLEGLLDPHSMDSSNTEFNWRGLYVTEQSILNKEELNVINKLPSATVSNPRNIYISTLQSRPILPGKSYTVSPISTSTTLHTERTSKSKKGHSIKRIIFLNIYPHEDESNRQHRSKASYPILLQS